MSDDVAFHSDEEINTSVDIEGNISPPLEQHLDEEFSTLDEPVSQTIIRDVKAIGLKFFHVLYPKENRLLLKEWDLWGPLVLCVFMAIALQRSGLDNMGNEGGVQFAQVFVLFCVGAIVITLNTKLLGGNISLFQGMCVLGYCMTPLVISLCICLIILSATDPHTKMSLGLRFVFVALGFGWSTLASTAFLTDCQPANRKALSVYPIFLFYFVISWLVVSHKGSVHKH